MTAESTPGPRRRTVPSRRRLLAALAVGALLGVIVALGVTAMTAAQRSTALLDLSTALTAGSTDTPAPDQADRFVQSELLYLNSRGFQRAVATAAGYQHGVSISAAQAGSTNVIEISATAADEALAVKAADTAVGVYAQHRKDVLTQAVAGLQTQLKAAQKALSDAGPTSSIADLGALQARVTTLQNSIDQAETTANSADVSGTVVESAKNAGATPTISRPVAVGTGLAGGALLGLLVVAVPLLLIRRTWSPDEASDVGVAVATPALPSAPADWVDGLTDRPSDDPLESASRLLAARLTEPLSARRPLVVVGAASEVGASFVAVNLATALARRRRTVLIPAGDVKDGTVAGWLDIPTDRQNLLQVARTGPVSRVEAALYKTPVSGLSVLPVPASQRWEQMEEALSGQAVRLLLEAGWTVVIDCPPATESTSAFELTGLDPLIGVVVARGRTTSEELTAAVDQLAGDRTQVTVLVDEGPRTSWRRQWARRWRSG